MQKVEMRSTKSSGLIVSVILPDKREAVVKFSGFSAMVDQDVADAMVNDSRHNQLYRRISLAEENLEKLQADRDAAERALRDATARSESAKLQTEAHAKTYNLPPPAPSIPTLETMTVQQLEAYATLNKIVIPDSITLKADIRSFIQTELAKLNAPVV